MHKINIAIIDNGIDETFLKKPLAHKIFVNRDGQCVYDDNPVEPESFIHGTNCAMIIEKYFPEAEISSIKILDAHGAGLLNDLSPALKWCLKHQIRVINLSLGTTHFKDKLTLRTLMNSYANQGLILIAASANNGYASYPASFTNVIGVAIDANEYSCFIGDKHRGIDVLVPLTHELTVNGEKTVLPKWNSYAAPYVTALIGKLYLENPSLCMKEVKCALQKVAEKYEIQVLEKEDEPDWIDTAWRKDTRIISNAKTYFKQKDDLDLVDTVITDDDSEITELMLKNKNILYLGSGKITNPMTGRLFWSPGKRLQQILNSDGQSQRECLDVPLILCELEDDMDEMFYLSELKKRFCAEGYHMYSVSLLPEGVLYDLDYIPTEALDRQNRTYLMKFLSAQSYYKQLDGIVFGFHKRHRTKTVWLLEKSDLHIIFTKWEQRYKAMFFCEGRYVGNILAPKIDLRTVTKLVQKTKEILVGDSDE